MECPIDGCDGKVIVTYEDVAISQYIDFVEDGQYFTNDIHEIIYDNCTNVELTCTNDHYVSIDDLE
jgi:hypothetical protein